MADNTTTEPIENPNDSIEEPNGAETEPNEDTQKSDDDFEAQAAHWKAMSRKNEDAFKKASKNLSEREAQLAERELTIARLQAQREHPQITDEMFETMCKETTPEGVAEWAGNLAKYVTADKKPATCEGSDETGATSNTEDNSSLTRESIERHNMSKVAPGKWAGASESEADIRKRIRKEIEDTRKRSMGNQ